MAHQSPASGLTVLLQLGYAAFIVALMVAESKAGRLDANIGIYLFSLVAGSFAIWWWIDGRD